MSAPEYYKTTRWREMYWSRFLQRFYGSNGGNIDSRMVIVRFILENLKTGILGGLPILLSYGLPRSLQLGLDEGGGHRAVLTRLN